MGTKVVPHMAVQGRVWQCGGIAVASNRVLVWQYNVLVLQYKVLVWQYTRSVAVGLLMSL